jgi:tRNA (guanine-N7-)-methyltransferase
MARTKLKRLIQVKDLPNVFLLKEKDVESSIRSYFKSNQIFTLEIGCGHGNYSVELAKRFPTRNFIGIDVKGARIFKGAVKALDEKLVNVAFLVGRAERLNEILPAKSVEEIFIPFPDPHIRRASHNRRLISPNFLKIYHYLLTDSGEVNFKTDNQNLFEYALKVITGFGGKILYSTDHLYADNSKDSSEIKTSFEEHYIKDGRRIKLIKFKFL